MDISAIFEAIGTCIQAIFWPIVVLIIFLSLRQPLKARLEDKDSDISLKASTEGFELAIQSRQNQAAAYLGAAAMTEHSEKGEPERFSASSIDSLVAPMNSFAMMKVLSQGSVLWVTVKPAPFSFLRKALEAIGLRVTNLALSMERALKRLLATEYDVTVFLIYELQDVQALWQFLALSQKQWGEHPILIYTMIKQDAQTQQINAAIQQELAQQGYELLREPGQLFAEVVKVATTKRLQAA